MAAHSQRRARISQAGQVFLIGEAMWLTAARPSGRVETFEIGRSGKNLPDVCANHPPLSCRTSPPQGGRLAVVPAFANFHRHRSERSAEAANLPPCGG
ncbi:hypothetical protein EN962_03515 [Mesorhizobium sp. M7A.F.Ca.CA.001.09.2.1]|nr:hypothetical protein EN994_19220 [Mesorhizobium sp. M7A.F.Ca.CA.002.09.1.1]RUX55801.1 hypothetical protein EOA22_26055 [Mesorhizobium sp. M7A.F.Ca.US.014.04.1.1]RUY63197.1 hypothetical protein EN965_23535 [Mesorhizobium sp. M7A.F.Ca.CA.001.05.1.1]RUY81027.1 hypothetical protein EN962_03515 [Mesorhizobium sp. M7A.F.Ca.CA.001.09.2.1]RUY94305.1 hypothetical protein EN969_10335 [Mesorhizobium sp. M7A.F.Ca.CA.003.01.2.1]RUZ04162.1 hypothetical protein EN958_25665 [Mesorhizobium sp. M7A.F.Ca.CA.0